MRPEHLGTFLEAAYSIGLDERAWLAAVVAGLRLVWGKAEAAWATIYDASDINDLRPGSVLFDTESKALEQAVMGAVRLMTPAFIARTFRHTLASWVRKPSSPELDS